MKNFLKSKIATIGILIATLILAGVAVFTAIRLYQLRQEAVAPNVPSSKPKAAATPVSCTELTFTLGTGTGSPTATPTGTGSPTATPTGSGTATPTTTGTATPTGTGSPTATPTATSTATAKATVTPTATAAPSLPDSGTSWPTVLGIGAGATIILFSLLLALQSFFISKS